jgi:hypothetical protein
VVAIDVNPDKNHKRLNVILKCLSFWGIATDGNPDKNHKPLNVILKYISCWGIAIDGNYSNKIDILI